MIVNYESPLLHVGTIERKSRTKSVGEASWELIKNELEDKREGEKIAVKQLKGSLPRFRDSPAPLRPNARGAYSHARKWHGPTGP